MSQEIPITLHASGYLEKWHRSTESRKTFMKKGDKVASFASSDGKKFDILAPSSGNMTQCLLDIGSLAEDGQSIAYMKACDHPAFFNSMCVSCGDIVRTPLSTSSSSSPSTSLSAKADSHSATASSFSSSNRVTVLTSGKQLQLTKSEAEYFQVAKQSGLRSAKKLALVLDLDHTLIHAAERSWPASPEENEQGISTLSLEETVNSGIRHYLVKNRPYLQEFLYEANKICQLSIYTAGTRKYAEGIAKLLDPDGRLFLGRIVSRSDGQVITGPGDRQTFNIEKSLSRVFLADTSLAVILDDREDVWRGQQSEQLLLVRPFKHFMDMQEINNTSGPTSLGSNQSSSQQPAILLSSSPPGIAAPSQTMTESDDQLVRSLDIIRHIHTQVFQNPSTTSSSSLTSVSTALTDMKRLILRGCVLTFSGIIPTNYPDPSSHFLWQLARSLGAIVSLDLIDSTTHLICTTLTSNKAVKGKNRKNIWILHPDWLFYCRWSMSKAVEATFSLVPLDALHMPNPTLLSDHDNGDSNNNVIHAERKEDIEPDVIIGEKRPRDTENDQNSEVFKQARIRDADEESWIDETETNVDDGLINVAIIPDVAVVSVINADGVDDQSNGVDGNDGNHSISGGSSDSSDDDWDLDDALQSTSIRFNNI